LFFLSGGKDHHLKSLRTHHYPTKTLSIPVLLAWVPHAPFQQSAPPEAEHAGTKALVDEVFTNKNMGI
jgi:hypothetical protein